jgi:hypothetical protein
MGQSVDTKLFYGIHLDPDKSRQMGEALLRHIASPANSPLLAKFPRAAEEKLDLFTLFDYVLSDEDEDGVRVDMMSEDTYGAIHNTQYEPGRWHGIGVVLGDDSRDIRKALATGTTPEIVAAFAERIQPFLIDAGLGDEVPGLFTVSNIC